MLSKRMKRLSIFAIIVNLLAILVISTGGYLYLMNEKKNAQAQVVEVAMGEESRKVLPDDFVDVKKYIPDIEVQLMYDTVNNVAGRKMYSDNTAYLRKATVDKLFKANQEFKKLGYRIKIWDAYRPAAVQYLLWEKVPDSRYIVEPKRGSVHTRGAAVDITLVNKNGREIPMPTSFDTFNKKADKDYNDVSTEQADNAKLLEKIMVQNGFVSVYYEWWHFNDKDWKNYDLVDKITPKTVQTEDYNIEVKTASSSESSQISSAEAFIERIKKGFSSIDFKKIKVQMQYELSKVRDIFNEYRGDV